MITYHRQEPPERRDKNILISFQQNFNRKIGDTMEMNPYQYDRTVSETSQQNQIYEGCYATAHTRRQSSTVRPQQKVEEPKPRPQERMSKARALALVRTFK